MAVVSSVLVQTSSTTLGLQTVVHMAPTISEDLPDIAVVLSFVGSLVSVWLVHKVKRVPLLVTSLGILTIHLAILAIIYPRWPIVIKILICSYIFCLSCALSSVSPVYILESFPSNLSAAGFGVVSFLSEAVSILILVAMNIATKDVTIKNAFWVFTGTGAALVVLSSLIVLETKKEE